MGNVLNRVYAVSGKAGIPREIWGNWPIVEIAGNKTVSIEGHNGILAYSECEVSIRTGIGVLTVEGTDLMLQTMSRERICILGAVRSVCWGG